MKRSFDPTLLTFKREKIEERKKNMEQWIIPCNIKYYDVIGAFNELKCLDWKQSCKSINVGDEIYIYIVLASGRNRDFFSQSRFYVIFQFIIKIFSCSSHDYNDDFVVAIFYFVSQFIIGFIVINIVSVNAG